MSVQTKVAGGRRHDPGVGAVRARAARLAQRLLRRPAVARRQGGGRGARRRHAGCGGQGARPRGRRRALARRRHAASRAHDAGRRQAAAAPPVRRHGAAGLRPVRLSVRDLLGGHRRGPGAQAQPVRARRQGDEPHAQASPRGDAGRRGQGARAGPTDAKRPSPRPPSPAAATRPSRRSSARPRASTAASRRRTRATSCFDIAASGLAYAPGDSFGLYPKNDPALAEAVRRALRVPAEFPRRRQDLPRCADRGLCARAPRPTRCSS